MTTSATTPHATARYRTTAHGTQVVIPTRCRRGQHTLSAETSRIRETDDQLHVTCLACLANAETDHTWSLATHGRKAISAEFDDQPYHDIIRTAR
ncbi:hypothetical protein LWC34_46465 [Kibdelosporangium philippinense]|uniref:Uncharacterized protein n=1 Tax=Kibdelosporangium philippinense TaxID=211113 RepID=A0ABS8ZR15_9PSEU|nr:hypothetical protein [Kibdelosporangium philippinense]MCE7010200.1 hypothetical protein [Kibdelosporangium philippinense]